MLATDLGAELLLFSTGVTHAYLHFGRENEKPLLQMSFEEASTYLRQGEFAMGSMGPKAEAALKFLERGGRRARWRGNGNMRPAGAKKEKVAV